MAVSWLKKISTPLRILVAGGLLAWLIHLLDFAKLAETLLAVSWWWIAAGVGLHLVCVGVNARRWQILLAAGGGVDIPFWRLAASQVSGQFFGVFLPGDVGADIYRIQDTWRMTNQGPRAVLAVLGVRALGLLALGLLMLAGLVLAPRFIALDTVWWLAWGFGGLCLLGAAALLQGSWLAWLLKAVLARSWWQGKWTAKMEPYVRELAAMLSRPDLMARSLGWSLVYQILLVVLVLLYGLAIGQSLGFTSLLVVVPLVGLVTVVPISLAGLGVREGAFVAFLGWLGLSMEEAFSIAVLSRLVNGVIIPLIGAAVFMFNGGMKQRTRAREATAPMGEGGDHGPL